MITASSMAFAVLAGLTALIQVGLTFGAPWGEFTLGGRHLGPRPRRLRVVAAFSAFVLGGFGVVVLSHAGGAFEALAEASGWLIWAVVGYCALGSVMNAVTPSRRERMLWLPVVLALLATSLVVALG